MIEVTKPGARPIVEMVPGRDGLPEAAIAISRVEASPAEVYALFRAIDRYPGRVPMISHVRVSGNRATVELRFKVAVFSAKFEFTVEVTESQDRSLEMRWVSGEPRDLHIRHDLEPLDGGAATLVRTYIGFDIQSLGWLVKYFLRHHPEIQFGVFSGTALAIQHSLKQALRR